MHNQLGSGLDQLLNDSKKTPLNRSVDSSDKESVNLSESSARQVSRFQANKTQQSDPFLNLESLKKDNVKFKQAVKNDKGKNELA